MLTVRNHSIVSPEMMPGICRIERLFPRLERCDWILVVNTNLKLSSSQCKYTKGKQLHTLTVLFASAGQTDFQCICAIQSRHMHPSQKYTAFCKLSFKVKVTKWIWQWTIFLKSRWTPVKHFPYCVLPLSRGLLPRVQPSDKAWHSYTRQCTTKLWFYPIWKVWSIISLL